VTISSKNIETGTTLGRELSLVDRCKEKEKGKCAKKSDRVSTALSGKKESSAAKSSISEGKKRSNKG